MDFLLDETELEVLYEELVPSTSTGNAGTPPPLKPVVETVVNVSASEVAFDIGVCLICSQHAGDKLETITATGIDSFVSQCSAVGRDDIVTFVLQHPDAQHKGHRSCRRNLCNNARKALKKAAGSKHAPSRKRTRASTMPFDFQKYCFYCAEPLNIRNGDVVHRVLTLDVGETVQVAISKRNCDGWALEVKGRLESVCDLVACDARYHHRCHVSFVNGQQHTPHKVKRGRPESANAKVAFDALCAELLLSGENDFFTLRQLYDRMCELARAASDNDDDVYSIAHFKSLLKTSFGDSLYFASQPGRCDVVGFRGLCNHIIQDKFLSERVEGEGNDAEKAVRKAAQLILAEIRETEYVRNEYPNAEDITGDGMRYIPPLLQLLLKTLISKPLKQTSLGQAIVQSAKPNGCIMPIMFGLGVQIDKLGHRQLHDEVAHLGFCISSYEINRFKHSIMQNPGNHESDTSIDENTDVPFTQYVADNLDHNVRTLDGLGTFHGMGIISATVQPIGCFQDKHRIVRCDAMTAAEATQDRCVPVMHFDSYEGNGLDCLQLKNIRELQKPLVLPHIMNLTNLWYVNGICNSSGNPQPSWCGYMQKVVSGVHCGVSSVEMLAVVDLNPSDDNCIYSTLLYIIDQAKSLKLPTASVTFDQPLYIKAVNIAMKASLPIVVRLGGFHTLMSFLGSIGNVMRGSGIEDVLRLLYGANTIEHILSGKAYARAVRGHFLVQAALLKILIAYLTTCPTSDNENCSILVSCDASLELAGSVQPDTMKDLQALFEQTLNDGVNADESELLQLDSLVVVNKQLKTLMDSLLAQSRTGQLWVRYIEYVDLVRQFLLAERSGNWLLHLETLELMLPLFSATGHGNYAKSVRVYLQQMRNLSETHPWLYKQFQMGNHVIRRSDRYWAGLSCDLVIEQTLMRASKSGGGLTHGRGMTETVRTAWLSTLTEFSTIHSAMTTVTTTDRQVLGHVEVGAARMKRDMSDLQKVIDFLQTYSPFRYADRSHLVTLVSGVMATAEDCVNCELALELGYVIHDQWDNQSYGTSTLKKHDRVKTMSVLTNASSDVKVKVQIDPCSLFHRLVLIGERIGEVKDCFAYELTPYPMCLFSDSMMRKPDKPALYRNFLKCLAIEQLPTGVQYVVDGGYLIHRVRWQAPADISDILSLFINYLKRLGNGVCVVFDGYDCGPSIKDHEHKRRASKSSTIVRNRSVDTSTKQIGDQEQFLANNENKKAFISVLAASLTTAGISVQQALGDADADIASLALQLARDGHRPIAVLAEDTDVLVLLLHHRLQTFSDIYFVSEAKRSRGGKPVAGKLIRVSALQHVLGIKGCNILLAVHAFGGCDSTSAIYGHGKGSILNHIIQDEMLQQHCLTLQSQTASVDEVCRAGVSLMVSLFGGSQGDSLSTLRYNRYCTMSLGRRFKPESLPPSESATCLHSMRTHYQAVFWATLGATGLEPTQWGWKLENKSLVPLQTLCDVAPSHMMLVVRCQCKAKCSSASCSCRKHGLQCVSACKVCHGTDCTNARNDMPDCRGTEHGSSPCQSGLSDLLLDDELYFFFEEEI